MKIKMTANVGLTLETFSKEITKSFPTTRSNPSAWGVALALAIKDFCGNEQIKNWHKLDEIRSQEWQTVHSLFKKRFLEIIPQSKGEIKNSWRAISGYWSKTEFRNCICTLLVKLCIAKKDSESKSLTIKEKCAILGKTIIENYLTARAVNGILKKGLILEVDDKDIFPYALYPDDPHFTQKKELDIIDDAELPVIHSSNIVIQKFGSHVNLDQKIHVVSEQLDLERAELARLTMHLAQKTKLIESLEKQLDHFVEQKRLETENSTFAHFTRETFGDTKFTNNKHLISEILVAINLLDTKGDKRLEDFYDQLLIENNLNKNDVKEIATGINKNLLHPSNDDEGNSGSDNFANEEVVMSADPGTSKTRDIRIEIRERAEKRRHADLSSSDSDENLNKKRSHLNKDCSLSDSSDENDSPIQPEILKVSETNKDLAPSCPAYDIIKETFPDIIIDNDQSKNSDPKNCSSVQSEDTIETPHSSEKQNCVELNSKLPAVSNPDVPIDTVGAYVEIDFTSGDKTERVTATVAERDDNISTDPEVRSGGTRGRAVVKSTQNAPITRRVTRSSSSSLKK